MPSSNGGGPVKRDCEGCRYCGKAVVREGGKLVKASGWCRMKDRRAPKNPCKFWRPAAPGGGK